MGLAGKYKQKSERKFRKAEKLTEKANRLNYRIQTSNSARGRLWLQEKKRRLTTKIHHLTSEGDRLWEIGDDIYNRDY